MHSKNNSFPTVPLMLGNGRIKLLMVEKINNLINLVKLFGIWLNFDVLEKFQINIMGRNE